MSIVASCRAYRSTGSFSFDGNSGNGFATAPAISVRSHLTGVTIDQPDYQEASEKLPKRPDRSAVNETIPLFYIGQNRKRRWVVRAADGRSGGLFLFKQWAVHFARRQSEPAGCAIMFVATPIEFEIEAWGRRGDTTRPRMKEPSPRISVADRMTAIFSRMMARILRSADVLRRNRQAIEDELFHGQIRLSSKYDDDLPVGL